MLITMGLKPVYLMFYAILIRKSLTILGSCKRASLNNILFQLYKPSAEDEKQIISIKELSLLCKYVYDKIYKDEINFVFEMSIPLCSLDKNMLTHMILKNRIITCCHIAKGAGMIFDSDFNILPCNHFMGHPLNDTKIKLDELVEFWNSNNAKQFRKIIGSILLKYVLDVKNGINVVVDVL